MIAILPFSPPNFKIKGSMIDKINKEREDTLNKVTNGVDVSAFI